VVSSRFQWEGVSPRVGLPGRTAWGTRRGPERWHPASQLQSKSVCSENNHTKKRPFHKQMLGRLGSAPSENGNKSGELSCPYSVRSALRSLLYQPWHRERVSLPSPPCWRPEAAQQKGGRAALLFPSSTACLLSTRQSGTISAAELLRLVL